jgi:hypothetical protein
MNENIKPLYEILTTPSSLAEMFPKSKIKETVEKDRKIKKRTDSRFLGDIFILLYSYVWCRCIADNIVRRIFDRSKLISDTKEKE